MSGRAADLEVGDTAGLEACATGPTAAGLESPAHRQPGKAALRHTMPVLTYPATRLTSLRGRTMTLRMVLPSRKGLAFSDALAARSRSAAEALAGTRITSRSLPLTWTGISRVSSTRSAGLNWGQGA